MAKPKQRQDGEGSVFQTKNNGQLVWCASSTYWHEGKRRFVRGFGATPQQAIANRSKNLSQRVSKRPVERRTGTSATTLLNLWLSALDGTVGPETLRKYRRDLEIHILPHLKGETIETLTEERCHKLFYSDLNTIGTSARKHAYRTFRGMLNFAVKRRLIEASPLHFVPEPQHTSVVEQSDTKWINKRISIAKGLLRWIGQPENPYHDVYPLFLMLFLGLRRAEILGLEWSCANQLTRKGHASIVIKQQLSRHEKHSGQTGYYIKPTTKSKKARSIRLPERWRLALIEEKKKQRRSTAISSDLIFVRPNGSPWTYKTFYDTYYEVLTAYINHKRDHPKPLDESETIRPHAIRHLCASILFDEGVSLEVVQEILGHSDRAMTLHYTHLTRNSKTKAAASLEKALLT
ncbi:hypothetical protein EJO69_08815 [Flaviflexus salsibiostraticola]|uniref:Site-specific integrase n=1 Tax=Flaviflexus salsibiostraticola TaxID=1282737 RepID=A0A3S8ZAA5_9ACTO|nr:tyrosine-type recombinase/integrase [Flaviflexus salsibiostraticola]AZN30394.1 hypothetical protein EJO69_08815 [Flaviflexus salsibiostraticola]